MTIADLQHDLAAVQIAELSVERRDDGLREQIGGDDPRELLEPAELADDRRQRRGDDRRVERGEQHHEQQAAEQRQQLPSREGEGSGLIGHLRTVDMAEVGGRSSGVSGTILADP